MDMEALIYHQNSESTKSSVKMIGSWYVGRCVSTKVRIAFLPGGMHSSPVCTEFEADTLVLSRVKAFALD